MYCRRNNKKLHLSVVLATILEPKAPPELCFKIESPTLITIYCMKIVKRSWYEKYFNKNYVITNLRSV